MPLNFPPSPSPGDSFTSGSLVYVFDGVKWISETTVAIQNSFANANAAFDRANLANGTANTALINASAAFDRANVANGTANTALINANAAFDRANLANGTANTAVILGSAAFNRANQQTNLAFSIVNANGITLAADSNADTLTILTSGNVSITADGAGDNITFDLTTTGVTPATYGSSTIVPVITIDSRGRIISASNVTITGGGGGGDIGPAFDQANAAYNRANTANLVPVQRNGSLIGTRNKLNFIQGSNITLNVVDDSAGDRINVSISATGGGGGGGANGVADSFETINKNLGAYEATLYYDGNGVLANIVYTKPDSNTIIKTLNFSGSVLNSIVLSGNTPAGITLTKTLNYSGDVLIGYTYS